MSSEFIGPYDPRHVRQPEGSEKCFAAIVASVADLDIDTAHQALTKSELSEPDGSTKPILLPTKLPLCEASTLSIEPLVKPTSSLKNTASSLSVIYDEIDVKHPVALLHKKTDDPADNRHHWILLTSRDFEHDKSYMVGVMDPLDTRSALCPARRIENLVSRSINYAGISACALVLEKPEAN